MKWRWFGAALILAVGVGAGLGWLVQLTPTTPEGPAPLAIRDVVLGTPVQAPTSARPWKATDRLTQKQSYMTTDPLALRVVSAEPEEQTFSLTVRLLSDDGSAVMLSPTTLSLTGGTSGYCCWYVATPGSYKLQIFRPREAPLAVPFRVVKQLSAPKSPLSL